MDLNYARDPSGKISTVTSRTANAAVDALRSWSDGYDAFARPVSATRTVL